MKFITRDTDYAVRALCFIARHKNRVVSAKELTKCLKIPRPFLRKILQTLNRIGFVNSYKGMGGGFKLNIASKNISLDKLIEVFQGPLRLNDHRFKKKICPEIRKCPLRKKLDEVERRVKKDLRSITIASLLRER